MKKILSFLAASLLLLNLFVITGCEDEPTTPDVKDPPVLSIGSSSDVVEGGTITVAPSTSVAVQLIGTAGTDGLKSISFKENGTDMDLDRLDVAGLTIGSATHLLEGTSDENGFTWDMTVTASDTPGTYDYSVTLTDAGGLSSSTNFTIVVENPTTPLDATLMGVLFNQAGPAGRGAIDLQTGNTTGISTADPTTGTTPDMAELRDMGIDPTIDPAVEENWRMQVTSVNGTEVRILIDPSTENFDFDLVDNKEAIAAEWAAANILPNQEMINGVSHDVSDPVVAGDIFLVRDADGNIFLIRVDSVDPVFGSNEDSYTLSIKY
ncbi:MAG TPA: hypothetical protein ENJ20_03350 [Bacteroidetes bacterium]|nr:hypothetical protein [Bacteroidota bacterium]